MDLQNRRYFLKRSLVALGVVATASASPAFGASFGLGGASIGFGAKPAGLGGASTGFGSQSSSLGGSSNGYVGRLSLEQKNASANSLTLTWNRYDGASKYKVYYKFDSSSSCSSKTVYSTSTTLDKRGWKKCSAYVVALSSNGSTPAKSSTRTEKNSSSNSKPKQLATPTWKNVKASGNTITLEWNAVRNAASYTVYYHPKDGGASVCDSKRVTETKFSFKGTPGTTYVFYVYANSDSSAYSRSNRSEKKSCRLAGKKLARPEIGVYAGKSKTVSISWTNNAGTPVCCVQWRQKGARTWKEVYFCDKSLSTTALYEIKNLTNNRDYEFRVKACATEDMRRRGYDDSDWSVVKTKRVCVSSYRASRPTFVEYNVARNSYGINFG